MPIMEAKKLCPNLIMQHVATWREGDESWAYHKDAFAQAATHKVSLDPYRLESRRILACIKDVLTAPPLQRVEKAGIDEVFLDLSAQIHSILLERYPEISGPPPYDDPTEHLPRPPTTALDWNTDGLVDLDITETEDDDPDWDDVAMLIGSEIVRSVRTAIHERLKYTSSAGIAKNKFLAKLGSAHKKPNQQTIVRNRAVQNFLREFKFTKIRNLGGKLGEDVVSKFGTDQLKELLAVPLEQLRSKLGDATGSWVFETIRGEDTSEVNSRTQIKSMLSAKSFRPFINTGDQALRWLRIFAADIFSRLLEEGVLENKRRPKTINLHHRQGGQMRSRQAPIPTGRCIDEKLLFDIAKNLLGQIVLDGRVWPCSNLSLSVGGFEDGPAGNRGIGSFLVRGGEAKVMLANSRDQGHDETEEHHPEKRRKFEGGALEKFLVCKQSKDEKSTQEMYLDGGGEDRESSLLPLPSAVSFQDESAYHNNHTENYSSVLAPAQLKENISKFANGGHRAIEPAIQPFFCDECSKSTLLDSRQEHEDWHLAKSLQAEYEAKIAPHSPRPALLQKSKPAQIQRGSSTVGKKRTHQGQSGKQAEKGQSRLVFQS